ncbi:hypothetical protein AA0614_1943 [Komagataeibacter saccharivorans NRIC 0614]|nr:hypothetical protein AA0614_1943 [Komagataeibacter saccharivorans NRIC 0614]
MQVGGGEYAVLPPRWFVDRAQPRMGIGAAYKGQFAHAGQADVANVLPCSTQVTIIFLAWDGLTHALFIIMSGKAVASGGIICGHYALYP